MDKKKIPKKIKPARKSPAPKTLTKEGEIKLIIDNTEYTTFASNKYKNRKVYIPANPKKILAFMPGNIEEIFVKKNDHVKAGDKLLILEAMKMKNEIITTVDGKIKQLLVNKNDKVGKSQLLIELS